jgi:hypothetical protein
MPVRLQMRTHNQDIARLFAQFSRRAFAATNVGLLDSGYVDVEAMP